MPVSGVTGEGIDALMDGDLQVHEIWNKRISTARLNRWLASAIETTPPPAVSGRRIKIRYMTQLRAPAALFRAVRQSARRICRRAIERFLINGLRQTFDLPGVPIRISTKTSENPYAERKSKRH